MEMKELERYTPTARWFHWVYVAVFLELVLSGVLIMLHWTGPALTGTIIRVVHRIGAVFLVGAPVLYALANWERGWFFVKEAFIWQMEDLRWVRAAPGYYFGGDPRMMPPQGYINTGMKLYRVAILFGGAVLIASGAVMWFLKGIVSPAVFQWSLVLHDVSFIFAIAMFFLHFQLGVLHPRMDESLLSMVDGKVSGVYAKSHHGKWYEEVANEKPAPADAK